MNGYEGTSGQWTNLSFSTSTGSVERKSGGMTVTFTFGTEKATINLQPSSSFLQDMRTYISLPFVNNVPLNSTNHSIDVEGNFLYIGGVDLAANAINANWNQDRVIFYKEDTFIDKNWVCYVRPFPLLLLSHPLISYYLIFWDSVYAQVHFHLIISVNKAH